MVGVDDRFGQSAPPWQLLRKFGLTAEHITQHALVLTEERSTRSQQHSK
jgi:transketolase C-terminal domain/subunit